MSRPADISEILEPVHTCLRELLEREKKGMSQSVVYTDDDVMAAALLFTHVTGNRLVHQLTEEKVGIGMASKLAKHYSALINEITDSMSGINPATYYKDEGSDK